MENETLKKGLELIGFSEKEIDSGINNLIAYAKELQSGNDEYGLTAIIDFEEIIIRHILDSLVALPYLRELKSKIIDSKADTTDSPEPFIIADIGSGGGIPGIPLAIMMNDTQFILAERMTKRCNFLNYCKEKLHLDNISVETIEAERIEQKRFDLVVFRAFRPLEKKMTRVLLRVLKDGGYLAAYKAKKEKIIEEMSLIEKWIPSYNLVELSVPFLENHERHLVVAKKPIN